MIEVDPFAEIDSLDRVELIGALEESFTHGFPTLIRRNFRAVRHVIELMVRPEQSSKKKSRKTQ